MKKIFLTLAFFFFTAAALLAQKAHFITGGTIEYDKTTNMYAVIKSSLDPKSVYDKSYFESYQNKYPQFKRLKSTLKFGENKTLFTPAVVADENSSQFWYDVFASQPNNTWSDLTTRSTVIAKEIYNEELLLRDTMRKVKWKITDETREIAGYTCRRANGIMMDSIYVVAFYTNKIPVFGGPESFNGLPGMILQVSLPHDNITWMATKVTEAAVPGNTIVPPKKGKPMNRKELYDAVKIFMKHWGKDGMVEMKLFLL